jgi:hypothetical protein
LEEENFTPRVQKIEMCAYCIIVILGTIVKEFAVLICVLFLIKTYIDILPYHHHHHHHHHYYFIPLQ